MMTSEGGKRQTEGEDTEAAVWSSCSHRGPRSPVPASGARLLAAPPAAIHRQLRRDTAIADHTEPDEHGNPTEGRSGGPRIRQTADRSPRLWIA